MIETHGAEFVDHHRCVGHAWTCQCAAEERRLATAKKSGEHGNRQRFRRHRRGGTAHVSPPPRTHVPRSHLAMWYAAGVPDQAAFWFSLPGPDRPRVASSPNKRAALPPSIAERSAAVRLGEDSMKPIGSISPISAG